MGIITAVKKYEDRKNIKIASNVVFVKCVNSRFDYIFLLMLQIMDVYLQIYEWYIRQKYYVREAAYVFVSLKN
jgi:hypothetical protein